MSAHLSGHAPSVLDWPVGPPVRGMNITAEYLGTLRPKPGDVFVFRTPYVTAWEKLWLTMFGRMGALALILTLEEEFSSLSEDECLKVRDYLNALYPPKQ